MSPRRDEVRVELLGLALRLRPDLADEIEWLYGEHDLLEALKREHSDVKRKYHQATVVAGELRQQLVRTQNRLEDCAPDQIAKARKAAFFQGAGFVRVTSLGGQKYALAHVPTEQVTFRAAD